MYEPEGIETTLVEKALADLKRQTVPIEKVFEIKHLREFQKIYTQYYTRVRTFVFFDVRDAPFPALTRAHLILADNYPVGMTLVGFVCGNKVPVQGRPIWIKEHGWNCNGISHVAIHTKNFGKGELTGKDFPTFLLELTELANGIAVEDRSYLYINSALHEQDLLFGTDEHEYGLRFQRSPLNMINIRFLNTPQLSSSIFLYFIAPEPKNDSPRDRNGYIKLLAEGLRQYKHYVFFIDPYTLIAPIAQHEHIIHGIPFSLLTVKQVFRNPAGKIVSFEGGPAFDYRGLGMDVAHIHLSMGSNLDIPLGTTHLFTTEGTFDWLRIYSRKNFTFTAKRSMGYRAFCDTTFWKPPEDLTKKDILFAHMSRRFIDETNHPFFREWYILKTDIVAQAQDELGLVNNWEQTYENYVKDLPRTKILLHFSTLQMSPNTGLVEALACGCIVLEYPNTRFIYNYGCRDGINCFLFNTYEELKQKYLIATNPANKEWMESMAKNARELALRNDTLKVVDSFMEMWT